MFNRKKNTETQQVIVEEKVEPIVKEKTVDELIDEIHESFFTEVDKLLAEAKIIRSTDSTKQNLLDKVERLKKLGFEKSKECVEAQTEIDRIKAIKNDNEYKKELAETISYFSVKYPQYKFITEDSVKKICEKYGLVYGEVAKYKGTVPDKNLKIIEDFKIDENDYVYLEHCNSMYGYDVRIISKQTYEEKQQQKLDGILRTSVTGYYSYGKSTLEIAAPLSDFDMTAKEVKDYKIVNKPIPDPIVLQPVYHSGKKHYLIVTAWGKESEDELVQNETLN